MSFNKNFFADGSAGLTMSAFAFCMALSKRLCTASLYPTMVFGTVFSFYSTVFTQAIADDFAATYAVSYVFQSGTGFIKTGRLVFMTPETYWLTKTTLVLYCADPDDKLTMLFLTAALITMVDLLVVSHRRFQMKSFRRLPVYGTRTGPLFSYFRIAMFTSLLMGVTPRIVMRSSCRHHDRGMAGNAAPGDACIRPFSKPNTHLLPLITIA